MQLNDYELIYMYRCGEKTALPLLLNKYKGAMVRIQRELIKTCPSIDKNDVFQELLLNFVKCLDLFDENKGVFFTYLYVCLKRTASHLLKEYFSPQERIHKTAISLDETTDLMDKVKLQDALINNDYLTNPSFCYEIKELEEQYIYAKSKLSEKELEVFQMFENGEKSSQIAFTHQMDKKQVRNCLHRAKKKIVKNMAK